MKLYRFKEIIVNNLAMSKETIKILITKCECDHPQPLSGKDRISSQMLT
jgi:hypothetical protein